MKPHGSAQYRRPTMGKLDRHQAACTLGITESEFRRREMAGELPSPMPGPPGAPPYWDAAVLRAYQQQRGVR
jgi:hypothetical protein